MATRGTPGGGRRSGRRSGGAETSARRSPDGHVCGPSRMPDAIAKRVVYLAVAPSPPAKAGGLRRGQLLVRYWSREIAAWLPTRLRPCADACEVRRPLRRMGQMRRGSCRLWTYSTTWRSRHRWSASKRSCASGGRRLGGDPRRSRPSALGSSGPSRARPCRIFRSQVLGWLPDGFGAGTFAVSWDSYPSRLALWRPTAWGRCRVAVLRAFSPVRRWRSERSPVRRGATIWVAWVRRQRSWGGQPCWSDASWISSRRRGGTAGRGTRLTQIWSAGPCGAMVLRRGFERWRKSRVPVREEAGVIVFGRAVVRWGA